VSHELLASATTHETRFRRTTFTPPQNAAPAAYCDLFLLRRLHPSYNVIAVPKPGEICVVDIDDPGVLNLLPQPLPPTLTVDTPSGGLHVYFKATPESDALGNKNVLRVDDYCVPDDKGDLTPLLELKVNNRTVAAPGSWNKEGISYKPQKPYPDKLAPFPSWLAEWIKTHASTRSMSAGKGNLGFRAPPPDFEIDDFFEQQASAYTVSKPHPAHASGCHHAELYVPECGCLYKGDFHEQSQKSGFMAYYDSKDNLIGFSYKCFATGCEGHDKTSVLDLMDHQKEEDPDYEPYPYYIYEDEDDQTIFDAASVKRFGVFIEYDELEPCYRDESYLPPDEFAGEFEQLKVKALNPKEDRGTVSLSEASAPSFTPYRLVRDELNEIRKGIGLSVEGKPYKKAGHIVDQEVFCFVLNDLKSRARFFRSDGLPYIYRLDTPFQAGSQSTSELLLRYGLMPKEHHTAMVAASLETWLLAKGNCEDMPVHKLGCIQRDEDSGLHSIYVNKGDGRMFRVRAKELTDDTLRAVM